LIDSLSAFINMIKMNRRKGYALALALLLTSFVCVTWSQSFNKNSYSRMPVVFGPAKTPKTEIEIQGNKYLLDVDFGCKFQLVLNNDILNGIKKKPYGTLQERDAKGNAYSSSAYQIKQIQIGNHSFNDVIVKETNKEYVLNTVLYSEQDSKNSVFNDKFGVVGRALLEKMNLVLDFQNSVIIKCDNLKDLERIGYHVNKLTPSSFDIGRTGFILSINTTIGKLRLSLDSGSTVSIIRSSAVKEDVPKKQEFGLSYVTTPTFEIGNRDFGRMNLYLHDITPELHEIDGLLGMDFLKNHVIYIDHKNKMVYVGDSSASANL
jgi:hypothetical protein